jgi:hypothetical protein
MSSFEILNQALLTYSTIVKNTAKTNTDDIFSLIAGTSNALKDMINKKADSSDVAGLASGDSNAFLNLLGGVTQGIDDRVRIPDYNADNILSNIRFSNLEIRKADTANTQLTGLTNIDTLRASGNIYTRGTLIASNLRILGNTSIINSVTTLTDQLIIQNSGANSAATIKQFGNNNIAEFYNSNQLATVIDKYGKIGINRLPRYELDIAGRSYITNMYGDSSKTTVDGVFIEDIFRNNSNLIASNTNLINYLRGYTETNFDIIESNIKIITNTINYGTDQLLVSISNNESPFITNKIISLEARIAYLEQRIL